MTFHYDLNARLTGHSPTAEERASLEAWFAEYDAASGKGDVAAMGDAAVFPLNLVSDDSSGNAWTGQWDRERFTATMTRVMGEAADGGGSSPSPPNAHPSSSAPRSSSCSPDRR